MQKCIFAKNTHVNIVLENRNRMDNMYNSLPAKPCRLDGDAPTVRGREAIATRVLPDRFLKVVEVSPRGYTELMRSIMMETAGVGPKVLDAYHCAVPGQRFHRQLAIEYERLDGTMREFLLAHRDEYERCMLELTAAIRVYETAVEAKLLTTDFTYSNIMYKIQPHGLRWYLVDFGNTVRLADPSVPLEFQNSYQRKLQNIERLRSGLPLHNYYGL